MLCRPYFTELFLTRSSTRPRLLFAVEQHSEWFFFSSPQPKNLYEKSSLVVAADFHMKFFEDTSSYSLSYASGLIYFRRYMYMNNDVVSVKSNPSKGQYAIVPLPELRTAWNRGLHSFLGFDPIDKQFKVLFMNTIDYIVYNETVHHISRLGTEKVKWRKIKCPLTHEPFGEGICINGVLYYQAEKTDEISLLVCFDVRSEKFKFIDAECHYHQLTNYKGKLCGINLEYASDGGFTLRMRVLEDVEKHEWSKYVYTLWDDKMVDLWKIFLVGVTATGEIVLSMYCTCKPFYVFYFNPERNTLQSVEIQGVGANRERFETYCRVHTFVDHVEYLNFNIMKTYAATSILPPEQKRKPTNTSTSSGKDHQVMRTSTSSRIDRQVKTVAHPQQDRRTFESTNKFNALYLLDDDEFTT